MWKAIVEWLKSLFVRKEKVVVSSPAVSTKQPTFVDTFQNFNNWIISTWQAPGCNAINQGSFSADHVSIMPGGGACLKLTQSKPSDGSGSYVVSVGGEISTRQAFGYGTYEFVMKASATKDGTAQSGSVTGCFNYLPNSETEIDFEIEGNERNATVQCTSWTDDQQPKQYTLFVDSSNVLPHQGFHAYKFVWSPGRIDFYYDGRQIATHLEVVPTKEAPMMFNHWGTVNPHWGGLATVDVERYMYVKSFKFTPL